MRWNLIVVFAVLMSSNICFSQQSGFSEMDEATEDWFMFPDKIVHQPSVEISDYDRRQLNEVQVGIDESIDRLNCNRKPIETIDPLFHAGTMQPDLGQYNCRDIAVELNSRPIAMHHLHWVKMYRGNRIASVYHGINRLRVNDLRVGDSVTVHVLNNGKVIDSKMFRVK